MEKTKIMIVDDDKEFSEELATALIFKNYAVTVVNDSATALRVVAELMPDAILMDIKIDRMNGFQLGNKIKQIPEVTHIPIIAITGCFINDEHFLSPEIFCMDTCLRKPFDEETLFDCLENTLSQKERI